MGISTGIPESWNLPLFWATVDGSQAGNVSQAQVALLTGQMFTSGGFSGTAALNIPIPVGSAAQAQLYFGLGSMLHRMCVAFFAGNTTQQLWCLPVPDPVAGIAATGTIIVNTVGSTSGVVSLYIAGQLVSTLVASTDTTTLVATNIAAAINALDALPVTATVTGAVITLTCQWAGLTGNDIVVMPNYRGVANGESYPVGLTLLFSRLKIAASAPSTTSVTTITHTSTTGVEVGMVAYDTTTGPTSKLGTVASLTSTVVTCAINLLLSVATSDIVTYYSPNYGVLTSGTGNPDFTTAIANIQLQDFRYVGLPHSDSGSLIAWGTEYGFGPTGRWNFTRQQYGMVLNARRDTYAALLTWGPTQNSPVISTMAIEPKVPTPVWEVAAAYAADAALGFSDDPARPLQTLQLSGILPALVQDRFIQSQRNSLVNSGFAVQGVDTANNMIILVEQSQYQFNAFSQSDTAYGKLTVLATLAELLSRMKSSITSKYPRMKLIPDGTKIGPGQAAVTPTDIKAELIAEYVIAEFDGLVANIKAFTNNLIVVIDDQNPNKVQVLWAPQLAGQLRQFDVLAQFRLMYPNTTPLA